MMDAEDTFGGLDAGAHGDRRRPGPHGRRCDLEDAQTVSAIVIGEVEIGADRLDRDLGPVREGIDRDPVGAVAQRNEDMTESRSQDTQPANVRITGKHNQCMGIEGGNCGSTVVHATIPFCLNGVVSMSIASSHSLAAGFSSRSFERGWVNRAP